MIIVQFLVFAFSLFALWKSSDFLVDSTCDIARKTGLSEFAVGAFIVGFGTSLPELLVSCASNYDGNQGIALGNVFGSNIFNVSCILGVSSLIWPLTSETRELKHACFALAVVQGLALICAYDGTISRTECLIMLAAFVFLSSSMSHGKDCGEIETTHSDDNNGSQHKPFWLDLLVSAVSLAVLAVSSRFFISSTAFMANAIGIPDLVVGMTVVAAGTSLPELVSSVNAAKKHKSDLILGNIVGSNLFNCTAVLGISGLVKPYRGIDCFFEIGLAFALGLAVMLAEKIRAIAFGTLMIATFTAYLIYNYRIVN